MAAGQFVGNRFVRYGHLPSGYVKPEGNGNSQILESDTEVYSVSLSTFSSISLV